MPQKINPDWLMSPMHKQFFRYALAIGFALYGYSAISMAAGNPPPTAASVSSPLSKAEFDAVVVEARRRARGEDAIGQPWESLDRDKLARLLRMPEFASINDSFHESYKEVLIKQAAAWELMPFEKPSDAQAMWTRWFPARGFDTPVDESVRSPSAPRPSFHAHYVVYDSIEGWGPEAGAQIALLGCLPAPAWHIQNQDPMIWALEYEVPWSVPNDELDFGSCVRIQKEQFGTISARSPETARGKVSAAVLEKKLSDYLLAYRCSGKGPDSCLMLLNALVSLRPQHEQLATILKALEPDFALAEPIEIPAEFQNQQRPRMVDEVERQKIMVLRRTVARKLFFLRIKIPTLLQQPQHWPADELENTLRTSLRLSMLMRQSAAISWRIADWLNVNPLSGIANTTPAPSTLNQLLVTLGRESSKPAGCDFVHNAQGYPAAFWTGFALEKLEHEQTSCGVFALNGEYTIPPTPLADVTKLYAMAGASNKPELLEPIAGLRKFLDQTGPAHDEVLSALGASCPEKLMTPKQDPWHVCQMVAKIKADAEAARKQEEQQQQKEAAELAAAAAQQALAEQVCDSALIEVVGSYRGVENFTYRSEDDGVIVSGVCKRWPSKPSITLVAVAYDTGVEDEKSLIVAMVDNKKMAVVSAYQSSIAEDASMQVESSSLHLDTARYTLASGVRAFGLDITSAYMPNCGDGGWGSVRTLFVQDGNEIKSVLAGLNMSEWSMQEGYSNCGSAAESENAPGPMIENFNLSLAISKTASNGYADLRVTAVSTYDDGSKSKRVPFKYLLHYNGKTYPLDGMTTAYWKWRG